MVPFGLVDARSCKALDLTIGTDSTEIEVKLNVVVGGLALIAGDVGELEVQVARHVVDSEIDV